MTPIRLGRLELANPILIASGVAANGDFLPEFFDVRVLGAFVTKGITVRPLEGNPPPRVAYVPGGMANSIGLQNVGIDEFLRSRWPVLKEWGIPIVANIYGFSAEEYAALADRLESAKGLAAIEINLSCPNVEGGGREVGDDPRLASELVFKVKARSSKALIAKLAPGSPMLKEVAKAVAAAGADAVCVGNTLRIRPTGSDGEPLLGNEFGGLSGPALKGLVMRHLDELKNVSVEHPPSVPSPSRGEGVQEYPSPSTGEGVGGGGRLLKKDVSIPLIAAGGVRTVQDARDYLANGASAVEIGTANLFDPRVAARIAKALAR